MERNARAIPFFAEVDRSCPSLRNFLHYMKKQPSRISGFRVQEIPGLIDHHNVSEPRQRAEIGQAVSQRIPVTPKIGWKLESKCELAQKLVNCSHSHSLQHSRSGAELGEFLFY